MAGSRLANSIIKPICSPSLIKLEGVSAIMANAATLQMQMAAMNLVSSQ
jgi:hypothetical protein